MTKENEQKGVPATDKTDPDLPPPIDDSRDIHSTHGLRHRHDGLSPHNLVLSQSACATGMAASLTPLPRTKMIHIDPDPDPNATTSSSHSYSLSYAHSHSHSRSHRQSHLHDRDCGNKINANDTYDLLIDDIEDIDMGIDMDMDMDMEIDIVKSNPGRPSRFLFLLISSFIMTGTYFAFDIPAATKRALREHLDLPTADAFETQFGLMYAVYSFPNILLPMLGGHLADWADASPAPASATVTAAATATTTAAMASLQTDAEIATETQTVSTGKGGRHPFAVSVGLASLVVLGQVLTATGITTRCAPITLTGRALLGAGGESLGVSQERLTARWFRGGRALAFAMSINIATARLGSVLNDVVSPAVVVAGGGVVAAAWCGVAVCAVSGVCTLIGSVLDARSRRRRRRSHRRVKRRRHRWVQEQLQQQRQLLWRPFSTPEEGVVGCDSQTTIDLAGQSHIVTERTSLLPRYSDTEDQSRKGAGTRRSEKSTPTTGPPLPPLPPLPSPPPHHHRQHHHHRHRRYTHGPVETCYLQYTKLETKMERREKRHRTCITYTMDLACGHRYSYDFGTAGRHKSAGKEEPGSCHRLYPSEKKEKAAKSDTANNNAATMMTTWPLSASSSFSSSPATSLVSLTRVQVEQVEETVLITETVPEDATCCCSGGAGRRRHSFGSTAEGAGCWSWFPVFPAKFYLLCFVMICFYGSSAPFNTFAPSFLQHKYYPDDPQTAGFVMSVSDATATFSMPLFGLLIDRQNRRTGYLVVSGVLIATSHFLLITTTGVPPLAILLLFGVASSLYASILWSALAMTVAEASVGAAMGIGTSILNFTLAMGPMFVAAMMRLSSTDSGTVEQHDAPKRTQQLDLAQQQKKSRSHKYSAFDHSSLYSTTEATTSSLTTAWFKGINNNFSHRLISNFSSISSHRTDNSNDSVISHSVASGRMDVGGTVSNGDSGEMLGYVRSLWAFMALALLGTIGVIVLMLMDRRDGNVLWHPTKRSSDTEEEDEENDTYDDDEDETDIEDGVSVRNQQQQQQQQPQQQTQESSPSLCPHQRHTYLSDDRQRQSKP